MMRRIFRFLVSRWFLTFVGTALLAGLVWFFGPLLAWSEPWWIRVGIVAAMLLVWFVGNLLVDRVRRRRDAALTESVTRLDPAQMAAGEEVARLRERLTTALATLKKARGTRGYVYEQPWYVMIGPPGAGKTTALLNAGLRFPLAAEMGQGAVSGIGGTRLCDWWFTEDAVLIDTAGRYTTQDSDAAIDRAGWTGFLDLLKRTRTRQPLNGVIVAIGLSEIAEAPPGERLAHARAIRSRIKEITERLALRLPVYAVFTKADLIAGFTEFFDDLDRERRAQVWGVTFAREAAGPIGPVDGFAAAFRALIERLNSRLIDRLQAERSSDRRVMLAGFPAQMASLEVTLAGFLAECFGGSRLDPAPMLRGVYFASGTQAGNPIDRVAGVLSGMFGLDQRRAPSLRAEQGRSYFLGRLLKDVVFNEAMLASTRPGALRAFWLTRLAGYGLAGLGATAGLLLLWRVQASNQAEIAASEAAFQTYAEAAHPLLSDPVSDGNLPALVPVLDQARTLPHGYDQRDTSWVSTGFSLGLSQADKLGAGARQVYRVALERLLLPRLLWRLESQMRTNLNRPDYLYEATRVYLMLGNQGPLDRDLVGAWMALDWQSAYPGPAAAPLRESLSRHLAVLLDAPLPSIALDGALVEAARATFSRVPVAERVYSRIRLSREAQAVAPWRLADALGAAGVQVFERRSHAPLTEGMPGFYTIDGFHKVLLPALGHVAKDVAAESWVLGKRAEMETSGPQLQQLERDVVTLYTNEYAKRWDALLADLNIKPLTSLNQAKDELYILGSPQSPLRDLLNAVTRQLTLSVPPPVPAGVASALQDSLKKAEADAKARLAAELGTASPAQPVDPPGFVIDQRYKALRDFVGTAPGAPIDVVIKLINDLQAQFAQSANASPGAPVAAAGGDPAQVLRTEALRQPMPISRWLQDMAASSGPLRGTRTRQQVIDAFNGAGGAGGGAAGGGGAAAGGGVSPASLCRQAVTGRYPFVIGATSEIPMDDFGRLFAPGGLLDAFFNAQLRPFVDMSGPVWKPQMLDSMAPPVAADQLAQFQRAAVIRDLFFGAGGNAPSVRFDITPTSLNSGAKQVTLDLDGITVINVNGPSRPTQVTWPGANRMLNVRLVFDPPSEGTTGVFKATGPWALFRLFDQGSLTQAGSPELYTLAFKQGERQTTYEIRAASVLNPFAPGTLHDFRCPVLQ